MKMKFKQLTIIFAIFSFSANLFAQSSGDFLGIKLRPEVQAIVKEIERKTGEEIYSEFIQQKDYMLGSSLISEDGIPVVLIDYSLEDDPKKLEAVIVHELLHLRLRVNNYPTFVFSPSVQTAKGPAIEVEQSNVNDLKNLIEHRVFKGEMERFDLYRHVNLAGDAAKGAKKQKGKEGGQTEVINYVRAILEYHKASDIEELQKIYEANNWKNSIKTGEEIAALISQSNPQTPQAVETVFLKCILKLYPPPSPKYTFKLTLDPENKFWRRMIINTATQPVLRKNK